MLSLQSNLSKFFFSLSTLFALSGTAQAAGWEWEWELLPTAWVDDVLDWSEYVQETYTPAEVKGEFYSPSAAHFCSSPPASCNDAIVFKKWAHYFLSIPPNEPLPEPFPLGCTNDCLVEE